MTTDGFMTITGYNTATGFQTTTSNVLISRTEENERKKKIKTRT